MTLPPAVSLALTILFALLLLPPLVWWGLWCFFALLASLPGGGRGRTGTDKAAATGTVIDVLIPAHNEELLLPRLLETLRLQTAQHRTGNVLVIADHCSDRTAAIAREFHVHVLERNGGPRGKPAALRDGIAWLAEHAKVPETGRALLILDADCTVSPNLIEQSALALDAGAQVTQAAYILDESRARTPGQRLHTAATIAFALKNFIRPKGMSRLGIPTQLFGTGMCFRCDLLHRIQFEDHLTEDLAISYELLMSGVGPRFIPGALVRSPLPEDRAAMTTQKLRWETGQVHTWTKLPAMLLGSEGLLIRGKLRSALAVIDWSAPPLAMAVLYWAGVTFALVFAMVLRWVSPWVAILPVAGIASLVLYVLVGGTQVSGAAAVGRLFLAVPRFFLWKMALYAQMLTGRGPRSWQRTPRTAPAPAPGSSPAVLEEATHAK